MSQYIIWPIFFACVRAGMQWVGGFLCAGGYISQSQETSVVGAGAFVAGLLWSIWQKVLANQRLQAAHAAVAKGALMPTCRAIVGQAMRALQALAPGDEPSADELAVGLEAIADLMLELHEARGPLLDIDAAADLIPAEDQRIRIEAGDTVAVTLPNSVPVLFGYDPYDYGFNAGVVTPAIGSTGVADGIAWRAPRDGARIEIVGVTQALYFYRADLNEWMAATGLTLDAETPLNARYGAPLAALVAERMSEQGTWTPTPALARRVARARAQLFIRPGVTRGPAMAGYL